MAEDKFANLKCTILVIMLLMSTLVVVSGADEVSAATSGDYDFQLINADAEVEITKYHGQGGNVAIPGIIAGKPVTSIGSSAISNDPNIISIVLPTGITTIGSYAFYNCPGLLSVTIPSGVTSIGVYAFASCSVLTSINIPSSVTTIGPSAFYYCTSLTSIVVPASVTTIGLGAFAYCSALLTIDVDPANPSYASVGGVLYDKALTTLIQYPGGRTAQAVIPASVTTIGSYSFTSAGSLYSLTIPTSVVTIESSAFANCYNLISINIPSSVTTIGQSAFESCRSLAYVTIPSSVTNIGFDAFSYCSVMTTINVDPANPNYASIDGILYDKAMTAVIQCPGGYVGTAIIPGTVTIINDNAFYDCSSMTAVSIPASVTMIGDSAFYSCQALTSLTIPAGVTTVGYNAFAYCSALTTMTIPSGVVSIESSAFSSCPALTTIDVDPANMNYASVGGILYDKAITTLMLCPAGKTGPVVIPGTVVSIGSHAFDSCKSITSVTIPDGTQTIGTYAFSYCTSLTSVTIPAGVLTIASNAFSSCSGLTSVTIPASVISVTASSFQSCAALTTIDVDPANVNYASVNGLLYNKAVTTLMLCPNGRTGSVVVPDTVTTISNTGFTRCSLLTSVTLPDTVTSIGSYAFSQCAGLKSVNIPNGVTAIQNNLFASCAALTSIIIPDGTTTIAPNAFYLCTALTSISIPATVTHVGLNAFYGCSAMKTINVDPASMNYTSVDGMLYDKAVTTLIQCPGGRSSPVVIPDTVRTIGTNAFYYCTSLTSVTLPSSLTSVGSNAFYQCSALTSVTVPAGVTKIGASAFSYCNGLAAVDLPSTLTTIGGSAFLSCTALDSISIPGSVTAIGMSAFASCTALTAVTIPASVVSIGPSAFFSCTAISAIDVDPANANYASVDGVLYDKTLTTVIQCPDGKAGSVVLPGTVTTIADMAFYYCRSLTSVTIPIGVTVVGNSAFYGASITSATIPASVTAIAPSAFGSCYELTALTISSGVTAIGSSAFTSCDGLTSVNIPASVTSIGASAFSSCNGLTSVNIPASVISMSSGAFYACTSLTAINVDPANAFYSSVNGVLYDKAIRTLLQCPGGKAGSLAIPGTVTTIADGGFSYCSAITSVTIPEGVVNIGSNAFYSCSALTSVNIPASVILIGSSAFTDCPSLNAINVAPSNAMFASVDGILYNKGVTNLMLCPGGKAGSITIPASVTSIANYAFEYCESITSVTIPAGAISIGTYAFYSCSALTSVTIPASVTTIGNYAFGYCSALTTAVIPANARTLGNSVFYYCSALTSVTIPASVTTIGNNVFVYCTSMTAINVDPANAKYSSLDGVLYDKAKTAVIQCPGGKAGSLVLPDTVTTIGTNALRSCNYLTSINIPNGVASITASTFSYCPILSSINVDPANAKYSSLDGVLYDKAKTAVIQCPGGKAGSLVLPDTVTTIGANAFYNCVSITSVTIPAGAISIGNYAFYSCSALTSISIPASVTSIGSYAFYNCYSLTAVTIPDGVTSIANSVFYSCSALTSVSIPASVTTIGSYAFYNCYSLNAVTIPASVTSIGSYAFYSCSGLTSMTIPSGVVAIGLSAFYYCPGLTAIHVDPANTKYASVDGVLYDKAITNLIQCPGGRTGQVVIPDTVTTIGPNSFYYCYSLTSVTLPSSLKNIGANAFYYCYALNSVIIPEGTLTIGTYAFGSCELLTEVSIPASVESIGSSAFYSCTSLTAINVDPANVHYASVDGVLYDKAITTLILCPSGKTGPFAVPGTVTSIGTYAFYYCSGLTSVTLPAGLTSIGSYAFYYCSGLTALNIPASVTSMGSLAIYYCSALTAINVDPANVHYASVDGVLYDKAITTLIQCPSGKTGSLVIPGTVTIIGSNAVSSCRFLTSVTIPASVTTIGSYAFYSCSALASVTIPANLTSIGSYAFSYCTALTSINVDPANTNYASVDGILYNKDITTLIQCPSGRSGSVIIPGTVTTVGANAFSYCYALTAVTIPSSVTKIDNEAFYYCTGLTSVTIPASVTTIGSYAFYECTGLTNVTIPASVTSIGSYAFAYCSSLTSVTIPASVTMLGSNAFYNCLSLAAINVDAGNSVYASSDGALYDKAMMTLIMCPSGRSGPFTIPASVTSVSSNAFYSCRFLTSVTIPSGVRSIGTYAFYDCNSLTELVIPSSVTTIGNNALYYSSALRSISVNSSNPNYASVDGILYNKDITTLIQCPSGRSGSLEIPGSVTSIGKYAFSLCTSLTSVDIPSNLTSIANWAFYYCSAMTAINVDPANPVYASVDGVLYDKSMTTLILCPSGLPGALVIPGTVTAIGPNAFYYCTGLTSVTIPTSVTTIGNAAFYYCTGLTSVTIPASVRSIGESAFDDCSALTAINIDPANANYSSVDGVLYNKAMTTLVQCPGGKTGAITLPATVASIGSGALYNCAALTAIDVASGNPKYASVDGVLYDKTLATLIQCPSGRSGSVTIPASVTSITGNAFYACSALTAINVASENALYASVDGVLYDKAMKSLIQCPGGKAGAISVQASITSIGYYAFYNCGALTAINVDSGNANYASVDGVLYDKTLATLIQCPGGKAGSVTIPASVTSIEDYALYPCSALTAINVDPANAYYASVDGVLYDKGIATLFQCPSGRTGPLNIPSSVKAIGLNAFYSCVSLGRMQFWGDAPACGDQWIGGHRAPLTIYYVNGTEGFTTPIWFGVPTFATYLVTGKVVDSDGKGLANITVALENGISVKTDVSGNFTIPSPLGDHALTVSGPGFDSKRVDMNVTDAGLALGNIAANKSGGDLILIIVLIMVAAVGVVLVAFVVLRMRKRKNAGPPATFPPVVQDQVSPQAPVEAKDEGPSQGTTAGEVQDAVPEPAAVTGEGQPLPRACPACGSTTAEGSFCGNCGKKL